MRIMYLNHTSSAKAVGIRARTALAIATRRRNTVENHRPDDLGGTGARSSAQKSKRWRIASRP
jgi:hypothetical protein